MNWIGWPRLIDSFLRWAGEFENTWKVKKLLIFLRNLNFVFMLSSLGQLTWLNLKSFQVPKFSQAWLVWNLFCLCKFLPMGKPGSGFLHNSLAFWALWPNEFINSSWFQSVSLSSPLWLLRIYLTPPCTSASKVVKQKKKSWTNLVMLCDSPHNWPARVWMSNHDMCRHH